MYMYTVLYTNVILYKRRVDVQMLNIKYDIKIIFRFQLLATSAISDPD